MSTLLVKRDPLNLVPVDGKVELYSAVPAFLSQSALATDPRLLERRLIRPFLDLLVIDGEEIFTSPSVYKEYTTQGVPGVWGGNRSALVQDHPTGNLFRIKGVAFGNKMKPRFTDWNGYDEIKDVEGGQLTENADNERHYTGRWNEILADKGIEPVAEYVATYRFPFRRNNGGIFGVEKFAEKSLGDVVASVFKVKGDTRIDELLFVLENIYQNHIKNTENASKFFELASSFCYDLGYTVGRLKRLMTRNRLTWSDPGEDTSAHYGNVVVYRTDTNNLGIGLVDLDSVCEAAELTKIRMYRQQQVNEYCMLSGGVIGTIRSYREIGPNANDVWADSGGAKYLSKGFGDGYFNKKGKRKISNKVSLDIWIDLLDLMNKNREHKYELVEGKFGTWQSLILTSFWRQDATQPVL